MTFGIPALTVPAAGFGLAAGALILGLFAVSVTVFVVVSARCAR